MKYEIIDKTGHIVATGISKRKTLKGIISEIKKTSIAFTNETVRIEKKIW